ncbi:hypothetical protein NMY22_g15162 [Coprinellus aureogranulatus]|nr:hypothetical protein NMY22_g15162 [Coprinellus aureogranulatus]
MQFEVIAKCHTTKARVSRMTLAHGVTMLPTFMPVATQAAIKGLTPQQMESLGEERETDDDDSQDDLENSTEGWVDERELMDEDEKDGLDASILPVRLAILKLRRLSYAIIHSSTILLPLWSAIETMVKEKALRRYELDDDEWAMVSQLTEVLKHATLFFSRTTPSLPTVIPAMDHIDDILTNQSLDREDDVINVLQGPLSPQLAALGMLR